MEEKVFSPRASLTALALGLAALAATPVFAQSQAVSAGPGSPYAAPRQERVQDAPRPATRSAKPPKKARKASHRHAAKRVNRGTKVSAVGIGVGAVAGGLLGSQVGGGTGKTLATIGGAVAGGYVGNRVATGQ